MLKNTSLSFGSIAKLFHWTIALLIAIMIPLGWWMEQLHLSPRKIMMIGWHKSLGITILALVVLRVLWRLINIQPALPAHMGKLLRFAAHATHLLLYVLMIIVPFSGLMMSEASGLPVSVFGLFTMPTFIQPDKALAHFLKESHGYLAWTLFYVALAHIAAALLHHFYYKDNVLRQMLPGVDSSIN